ncbi:MAG TPA: hypothetical protein VK796_04110 [Cytophaga sp.]|jgi:hypothetical protein|nr:hypothetical protein [Cytophaga sp.]
MKRIYVILFAAALSASVFSCKEKTASEKFKDKMDETGHDIKDAAHDAGDAAKDGAKETKEKAEDIAK